MCSVAVLLNGDIIMWNGWISKREKQTKKSKILLRKTIHKILKDLPKQKKKKKKKKNEGQTPEINFVNGE